MCKDKWALLSEEKFETDPVNIRFRPSIHEEIRKLSAQHGLSKSQIVNDLLSDALNLLADDSLKTLAQSKLIIL